MNTFLGRVAIVTLMLVGTVTANAAGDQAGKETAAQVYPATLLPFQERDRETKELGLKVTDLLFAQLAAEPNLVLVDREDITKLLEEQELSLSGLMKPHQANRVGQLTGAKLLITGSVLQTKNSLYLIAKIIGTETSEVKSASVKGDLGGDLAKLTENLSKKISETIAREAGKLVAQPASREDRLASLRKKLGDTKRPSLTFEMAERHIGQAMFDPASEAELSLIAKEAGFRVLDAKGRSKNDAAVVLRGEAFSDFAIRRGNLVSVKARVELKAVNQRTGEVLAVDRQTSVAVDLSEQIAAKNALQEAAAALAERMLPKIVINEQKPSEGR